MIVCPRCGFDNQLGHLFCSRCRARLDLRRVADRNLREAPDRRSRKAVRITLFLLLLAAVALALALLPDAPPAAVFTRGDLQQARRKLALLEKGALAPPQGFTEAEVNACLMADLSAAQQPGAFQLQSVQARLKPNAVVLSARAAWSPVLAGGVRAGSLDISYVITAAPRVGEQGLEFQVLRGRVGRLPLPGPLVWVAAPDLRAYFRGLRRNYPALGAVKRLALEEGKATLYVGK